MPIYFNLYDHEALKDEDGYESADAEAAKQKAMREVRDLIAS